MRGLAAVATWLAGEPHGFIVFVGVFLAGGCLIGWVDAAPRWRRRDLNLRRVARRRRNRLMGTRTIPGAPPPPPNPTDGMTREEALRCIEERDRWHLAYEITEEFERTKGTTVVLGNREVQLPPDAGIFCSTVTVHFAAAQRPDGTWAACDGQGNFLPHWPESIPIALKRGASRAFAGHGSGRLISAYESPGEEGAFDFLKAALG